MNLSMFNIFCPSLKAREHLKERVDLSKFNGNEERYVIPMHRKFVWTNKWMQEPRICFCRLQVQHLSLVCSTKDVGEHLKQKED
jgi:hypothetical protein